MYVHLVCYNITMNLIKKSWLKIVYVTHNIRSTLNNIDYLYSS